MFVCGGENIYPGEVEEMLERHPGIHQAPAPPVPDDLKGHKPVAFRGPGARDYARRAGGQGLRARQRAGDQHPRLCVLHRRHAARQHQQDRAATGRHDTHRRRCLTVKAAVVRVQGGTERLAFETGVPDPEPGEGDVVLAVKACSLNYHDVFTRRGMPGSRCHCRSSWGADVAGEIVQVGPGVTGQARRPRARRDPVYRIEGGLMGENAWRARGAVSRAGAPADPHSPTA